MHRYTRCLSRRRLKNCFSFVTWLIWHFWSIQSHNIIICMNHISQRKASKQSFAFITVIKCSVNLPSQPPQLPRTLTFSITGGICWPRAEQHRGCAQPLTSAPPRSISTKHSPPQLTFTHLLLRNSLNSRKQSKTTPWRKRKSQKWH